VNNLELALKVADAVLYEGYLLYPYRASAAKNRVRWQFGVVVPRGYSEGGGSEPWLMQTECLVEPGNASVLDGKVRFLQLEARNVEKVIDPERDLFSPVEALEVGGQRLLTWDDGVEREIDLFGLDLAEVVAAERCVPLELPEDRATELIRGKRGKIAGRIVRKRWPISAVVRVTAEALGSLVKVRIRVENLSRWPAEFTIDRNLALRRSLVGAHTLLEVRDGGFVSLLDPPEWARPAAAACVNLHTWPVLIGDAARRDLLLSSPIILYDYPQVAPESPGDLFDATEIDEILTLRTMTLTDEEKREARGTDSRAGAIIDRIDTMPAEILERLHGTVRYLRQTASDPENKPENAPWWDPTVDRSASPEIASIRIGDVAVSKGSRVRLHPGRRRADAQDMFLEGRLATVEGVFFDLEDNSYLAVTLTDDPAADLYQWHGRFLYFAPDEVEPLDTGE
jgi:hypothetical protein